MSWTEPDEPEDSEYCEAVRIGQDGKEAEVTIFYTPTRKFQVHNGYLAEKVQKTKYGRSYYRLKIVTPKGKIIFVRRYDDDDDEEFVVTTSGYWLSQKDVKL